MIALAVNPCDAQDEREAAGVAASVASDVAPWLIVKCPCGDPICAKYFVRGPFGSEGRLDLSDAQLVAAAPVLLAAVKAQHEAIDRLFALLMIEKTSREEQPFYPSQSGQPWAACVQGNAAIAIAEGRQA